jgi:hypothetical protein
MGFEKEDTMRTLILATLLLAGPSVALANDWNDFGAGLADSLSNGDYSRQEMQRRQRDLEYQQQQQQMMLDRLETQRKQAQWRRFEADMNRNLYPPTRR